MQCRASEKNINKLQYQRSLHFQRNVRDDTEKTLCPLRLCGSKIIVMLVLYGHPRKIKTKAKLFASLGPRSPSASSKRRGDDDSTILKLLRDNIHECHPDIGGEHDQLTHVRSYRAPKDVKISYVIVPASFASALKLWFSPITSTLSPATG